MKNIPDYDKWKKKVMPFVAFTKDRIAQVGMSALDLTLEFDEHSVLVDNMDYIVSTLQLDGVNIAFSDEASEKTQEECRPGAPFITFRVDPSVDLNLINDYCLRINDFMQGMFRGVGIKLVDFKLEFGIANIDGKNEILLADEISPDTCRLWDVSSEKKLDKDRFRKDLGNIIQAYQEVARRLGIIHEEANISEVKFGKPKAVKIKN